MSDKLRIGITQGDPNGIGLEVAVKAVIPEGFTDLITPVIFASASNAREDIIRFSEGKVYYNIIKNLNDIKDGVINIFDIEAGDFTREPGVASKESGRFALKVLNEAVNALKNNYIDVLVTAPVNKEMINSEQISFSGHTEFLEKELGDDLSASLMILFYGDLRVALATTHLPLNKISESITEERIIEVAKLFDRSLKMDFSIERPRIAILSLNPHNGDGGLLGREEELIIKPAIEKLREEGILTFGPYATDGFFGNGSFKYFDGVIAMYHDQGLAPFKALSESKGVNFTAGLPFIRTSPDHGTAFDIASEGIADETSMRNAIYEAIDIFKRRKNYLRASKNPLKKFIQVKPDRDEKQEVPQNKVSATTHKNTDQE